MVLTLFRVHATTRTHAKPRLQCTQRTLTEVTAPAHQADGCTAAAAAGVARATLRVPTAATADDKTRRIMMTLYSVPHCHSQHKSQQR